MRLSIAIFQSGFQQTWILVPLFAYIDPNAMGLISQIAASLLVMGAAAWAFLRKQIGAAFSSLIRLFRRRVNV